MSIGSDFNTFVRLLEEFSPSGARRELRELRRYATDARRGAADVQSALRRVFSAGSPGGMMREILHLITGQRGRSYSPSQIDLARQLLEAAGYIVTPRGSITPPPFPGATGPAGGRAGVGGIGGVAGRGSAAGRGVGGRTGTGRRRQGPTSRLRSPADPETAPGTGGELSPIGQPSTLAPPPPPFSSEDARTAQPGRGLGGRVSHAPPLPGEAPDSAYGPETLTPQSSNVYSFSFSAESRTRGILYVTYKASVLNASGVDSSGAPRHKGGSRQMRGKRGSTVTSQRKNEPGPTYAYLDVPAVVYHKMQQAQSKGKFVWDALRIRGTIYGHQYQYKLVHGQVTIQDGVSGVYIPRKATRRGFALRSVASVGRGRRSFQSSTLGAQHFSSRR